MPSDTPQAPQKATFTDHEKLHNAIDDWQLRDWLFDAFVLVVPAAESPYMVAGTNPLACQLLADDAVRLCCNASHRFTAAADPRGDLRKGWTGTVCDLSAARGDTHPRNDLAESLLTAIAIDERLPTYTGALYGTVAFHRTGELPGTMETEQAVRLLKRAVKAWCDKPQ